MTYNELLAVESGLMHGNRAAKSPAWASVKAICFDLDGTLYRQTPLRVRMGIILLREWVKGRVTARDLRAIKAFRKNKERARSLGACQDLDVQILAATAKEIGCGIERVSELVDQWIHQIPLSVLPFLRDPELPHMLERLHLRGFRLGVYSDYPVRAKLEALGLPLSLFDVLIESGDPEVSTLKPHPKGFEVTCRRLNVEPHAVLYIGDRDSIDGVGARSVGMQFALYKPRGLQTQTGGVLRRLQHLENQLGTCNGSSCADQLSTCWLCGSSALAEFAPSRIPENPTADLVKITDSQYGLTGRLLRCLNCGFIQADMESINAIEPLYRDLVDQEYEESAVARRKTFAQVLKRIRDLRPNSRTILDVGAGIGAFCLEAKRAGFEVEGVEPSAWAIVEGRKRGITLHEGYFPHPDLEGRKFDVVALLDVIEHVSKPIELLKACHRCLAPGGLLVLVTPDVGSLTARTMGHRWWHFRFAHIGYFSRATLKAALGTAGFVLETREPYTWWFPLTYVLERLERYLPIRLVNRLLAKKWMKPIARMQFPICLRDSYINYARTIEVNHVK
jgi:HAD superfamily hydrolase (TIGR01549 family)